MYLRTSERFWSKVANRDDPESCWVWTDRNIKGGYGSFGASVNGRWKHFSAHRWSYAEANGPIPPGMVVCHRCDNPPCVNPAHLFLGTQRENVQDMLSKGRNKPIRGTGHATSKLTIVDVEEIRRLVNVDHVPRLEVARRFQIHHSTVRKIALGRQWAHVPLRVQPWDGRPSLKGTKRPSGNVDADGRIKCGRCGEFKPPPEYYPSCVARGHGYCRPCFRDYYTKPHPKCRVAA